VGTVGMMTKVSTKPKPSLLAIGILLWLKMGAAAMTPRMRVKGHNNPITQPLSISLVNEII
jgi:hypothetical protein